MEHGNNAVMSGGNAVAQKLGYNGKKYEQAISYNMNEMDWRHYDPAIARWVAIDPIVHFSTSPYSAFENDPVFWSDPSGLDVFYNTQMTEFTGKDAQNFFSAYVSMLNTGEGSFTYEEGTVYELIEEELVIDGFRLPGGRIGLGQLSWALRGHVYAYADVYQYRRDAMFRQKVHDSLDMIGFVDPFGVADGINAIMYSSEGNAAMAAISVAAILPMGDLAKGLKYADKAHTIYQAVDLSSGAVKYVGITSRDLAAREAEHKAKDAFKDLFFEEVGKTSNKLDARTMEQKLINNFGLDNLYNNINSIAPSKWAQHGIK